MHEPETIPEDISRHASREQQPPPPASFWLQVMLLLVAALVVAVDHLSKLYVEQRLPLNMTVAPLPGWEHLFRITHVSNTGAAFGLFPGGGTLFTVVAFIVAAVIIIYNFQLPGGQPLLRVALGLQLGGALGNLIDRLRLGHVTDFLDFGNWPVFNLADTAIVGGVAILGLMMVYEELDRFRVRRVGATGEDEKRVSSLPRLQQPSKHEPTT